MSGLGLTEFADRVNDYMRVIVNSTQHLHDNELFRGKITMPQYIILDYLLHKDPSNMTVLAGQMHVSLPAMTGVVDRLVRDGCVQRSSNPDDRRLILVRLTPKGSALVKKINAQRRRMIMEVFGELSATDRANYLEILAKVKDVLSR